MAVCQELALIKMENPSFIKSQLLINGENALRGNAGGAERGALCFLRFERFYVGFPYLAGIRLRTSPLREISSPAV